MEPVVMGPNHRIARSQMVAGHPLEAVPQSTPTKPDPIRRIPIGQHRRCGWAAIERRMREPPGGMLRRAGDRAVHRLGCETVDIIYIFGGSRGNCSAGWKIYGG